MVLWDSDWIQTIQTMIHESGRAGPIAAQALEVRPVPFVALDALQAAQGAPLPTLDLVVW